MLWRLLGGTNQVSLEGVNSNFLVRGREFLKALNFFEWFEGGWGEGRFL